MTKSELIKALNEKLPDLQSCDVGSAVNYMLQLMKDALVEGEWIEIRSFGSFDLKHQLPRIARNPKTGEAVNSPAKVKIHFKPGKEMRDRVNEAKNKYLIELQDNRIEP